MLKGKSTTPKPILSRSRCTVLLNPMYCPKPKPVSCVRSQCHAMRGGDSAEKRFEKRQRCNQEKGQQMGGIVHVGGGCEEPCNTRESVSREGTRRHARESGRIGYAFSCRETPDGMRERADAERTHRVCLQLSRDTGRRA
jgi:hypothetical protein